MGLSLKDKIMVMVYWFNGERDDGGLTLEEKIAYVGDNYDNIMSQLPMEDVMEMSDIVTEREETELMKESKYIAGQNRIAILEAKLATLEQ